MPERSEGPEKQAGSGTGTTGANVMRIGLVVLGLILSLVQFEGVVRACSCGDTFLVWPTPNEQPIPKNARFFVVFLGSWSEWSDHAKDGDFALVDAEGAEVPLRIGPRYRGDKISALEMVPELAKMVGNKKYSMRVRTHASRSIVYRNLDNSVAQWTVKAEADRQSPVWTEVPTLLKSTAERDGCFHRGLQVEMRASDSGRDVPVVVEIRSSSGASQAFPVLPDDLGDERPAYFLGEGICGGKFKLRAGEEYELRFVAVDAAGNKTESSKVIRVKAP
jgi:hypothetical protein